MEEGSDFNGRFRWPAQDRVRARLFSKAPRKSPVCTASVYRGSVNRFPIPWRSLASRELPLLSRAASGHGSRSSLRAQEFGCGCCRVRFPGQSSLFVNESPFDLPVPEVDTAVISVPTNCGVALGFYRLLNSGFKWVQGSDEADQAAPDWRLIGEQDEVELP